MKSLRLFVAALLCNTSLLAATPTIEPMPVQSTNPVSIELTQLAATLKLENALAEFVSLYHATIQLKRVHYGTVENDLAPAYLFTPVNVVPGRKYPGLVFIRESAHGQFGNRIFDLIEQAIARGYVVICPDIRGSSGYGLAYYKKIDIAGGEVDDVLSATDFLVASTPIVDPKRLAIMGVSHGGLMTLLAIEKAPDRFKAAVDVVGPTNLTAYAARRTAAADRAEFYGQPSLAGADKDPNILVEKSPIAHVAQIRTPLLILAASKDTIVPVEWHQVPLLAALEAAKIKHEYQLYPNPPGGHQFFPDTLVGHEALSRAFDFLDAAVKTGAVAK